MLALYVHVTMHCQVTMLRSVEYCDERMGKEAAMVHFEFASRIFGKQCVTFTGYWGVLANKAVCVWTDAVEVAPYRVH